MSDITRTLLQQPDLASLSEAPQLEAFAAADSAGIVLWQAQSQRAHNIMRREKMANLLKKMKARTGAHGPARRILAPMHCTVISMSLPKPRRAACRERPLP
ncbi:hypothetical protein KCP74_11145 [Salmonella enterica subsp. enterica]|nr:hypothetical protein KCP74_11145 [Salmonella enterica subsp. enterica]